ncbi:hypothetical protein HYW76_04615 [Candidatus Pacearchaeota archaeon]|nr:hypothetical protein [Candidatus Pacearchaeota archaeon]
MDTSKIPYRIDLAGGWLDQPWVSNKYPGAVITISILPTHSFNGRSGMATSTRKAAQDFFRKVHPHTGTTNETLAELIFEHENPPGKIPISGSQDALGIFLPNANRLYYAGKHDDERGYWPAEIISISNPKIIGWLESSIRLIPLGSRKQDFRVLDKKDINEEKTRNLAEASDACWEAIKSRDTQRFGEAVRQSFEAQKAMFSLMSNPEIEAQIRSYEKQAYGWKLSGAGGGGYLILITNEQIEGALEIKIRRS